MVSDADGLHTADVERKLNTIEHLRSRRQFGITISMVSDAEGLHTAASATKRGHSANRRQFGVMNSRV